MKSLKTKKLNRVLTLVLTFMALMAGQTAWAENGWDIQASTSGTTTTFTISRTNTAVAETVKYRLVNLSAYAGQHYNVIKVNGEDSNALSGDLVFSVGDKSKTVQVRESAGNNAYAYYKDDTERSYKLEVTDIGGFYLTSNTRSFTKGTSIKSDNVYAEKSVTVKGGETKVTDDNYKQAYHAVTVDNYYTAAAPKAYLEAAGAELRMTLGFQAKESDDGYQHVQILVNQTSNHDEGSGNNNPGTMNYSSYMACFCHEGGTKNTTYSNYVFPDVSHGHDCGNVGKVWSSINSTNDVGELRQQYFNSNCRASDGRLIIASKSGLISFSTLGIRFDASGDNEDTWYAKDVKAYIQAVDVTAPTMLANSITVAPGRHSKGNTVYVSVAFNEIVKVTGTPKLTTTSNNNWGDLNYVAGDGTNVLTFSTTIPANASGNLNITSLSGTVKDLAGNSLTGSGVTASGLCSVDASFAYTITYNLGEGVLPDGYPTTYTYDAAVTLTNPTKTGYWFNGWTGSNGNTPNTTVTIVKNSHGNKSYTANWTNVWGVSEDVDGSTADKAYTITTTQGLDLLAQYVNSGNETSGKFFQLGGPIEYTHTTAWNVASNENNYTAIGTNSNPFKGTFDGNNNTVSGIRIYKGSTTSSDSEQGLFGALKSGGTVKRVTLADARITGFNCVGGIASSCFEATIEDCIVGDDVCIHAVANDASYHGGIVGYNQAGPVRRCISRARLTVANGKTGCMDYGGIVGYNNGGTITDCIADGVVIPDVNGRGAIDGYNQAGTLTRNYYHNCKVASESVTSSGVGKGNSQDNKETTDVTTNQGALPLYAVTLPEYTSLVRTPATNPTLTGTGNATYISGADIDGVPYARAGATLNLSYSTAVLTEGYSVAISAAQTTGGASVAVTDNGDYTYIISPMPAADVTVAVTPTNVWGVSADIDGSTAEKAYIISDTRGLDLLATLVNNGNDFEGKFFKLGDDITYTHGNSNTENNYTAIGCRTNDGNNKNFCGTFDGQGKTISGIRIYKDGTTGANSYQGLFGMVSGATIKNVILADARITGKQCVGGIAGYIGGIVENCHVGSDVTIHAVANYANYHGGVVGNCNNGTVRGCVSAATLTVANGLTGILYYGGIVGRLSGNMSDCLALGASVPVVEYNGAIAGYVSSGTRTNNYYHDCTVGANTHQSDAYTISASTNVTVAPAGDADATYEYKGIQRYGNALYYGGKLYAPEAADVSLTLDYPVPAGLTLDYTATAGTLNLTPNPSPSGEGSYTLTVPAEDVTINASLSAKYIAADGTEQTCTNFTLIQSSNSYVSLGTSANNEAWYVVSGEVTINGKLSFNDKAVHLILCDGASLSATCNNNDGIECDFGSLTIYGQSQQSGTLTARSNDSSSGIDVNSGDFTVNGGNITATSKNKRGIYAGGYNVTINRGSVTATSEGTDFFAYGIHGKNVTINGGTVSATGGEYGILANTITLGWTSPTDHIYASSYCSYPTVKSGQTLTDGTAAYSGTVSTSDINDKTLWPDLWGWASGKDGSTEAKAFTITTTGGLDLLATLVNNGEFRNFEGKFFKLGNDITYTHTTDWNDATSEENNFTAIGTYNKLFCGTFDGQGKTISGIRIYKDGTTDADSYQGLFGLTSDATIKNVILADARITGKQYVGGIAGYITKNNNQGGIVENCRVGSDVTIHAVANSANYHGGVVGECNGGTVRGCVSAATLTVANGLTGIDTYGGIVGYLNGNMSDCLAIGATVPAVDNYYGAIAGRCGTHTNNYYHDCTVGDATHQSDAYTISAGTNVTVAPAGDADLTFPYEGIQRYGDALYYNGVLYVPTTAAGNDFSLTLGNTGTPATGFVFNGYTATAGTLNLTPNPSPSGEGSYTLTMPAEDVTINAKLKVSYIDENGDEQWCTDYTLITSSDEKYNNYGADGQTNWYVVSGDVTINGQLCFRDSYSHLIVCDGASLSVSSSREAIYGSNGGLTIYGQAQGSGIITANGGAGETYGIIANNNITINGCTVNATRYIGIHSDDVTINRGTVTATGSIYGIFGSNVTINGGTVTATGGSNGIYANNAITLGWTNPTDRIYASSYAIFNYEFAETVKVKDGQALYAGYTSPDGVTISKFTGTIYDNNGGNPTGDLSVLAGKTLEPGIPFYVSGTSILLDDDSTQPDGYKNVDRLEAFKEDHNSLDIMLYGRTLYRDGDWNTLCLPFSISREEIEDDYHINPLHGATIMYFDKQSLYDAEGHIKYSYADGLHRSGEVENGSLHLYFYSDYVISTGEPYIVKWDKPADYDTNPAAYDIVNPVFQEVTIYNTKLYPSITDEGPGNVTFRGTYNPIKYESDNHSILFLGMNNMLYWPKEGAHIGAFRAYFELGNGITVGEEASQVRSFNLGFGEGSDETGIDSMHNSECLMLNEADAWYSLDGRKLDGKPNAKGMYIHNGKKVVIK